MMVRTRDLDRRLKVQFNTDGMGGILRRTAVVIGAIADTHGLLRPSAVAALQGCDAIVHAGDIGKPEVLEQLRALGPVTAVPGNVDLGWARARVSGARAR
jgi:hypothetical protein